MPHANGTQASLGTRWKRGRPSGQAAGTLTGLGFSGGDAARLCGPCPTALGRSMSPAPEPKWRGSGEGPPRS